jgi:putative endonuclease
MSGPCYFVYILASATRVLYVGVTNDLHRRLVEHRNADRGSFTGRYRVKDLVYVESCSFVGDALRREKQLKSWTRARKVALIEAMNPGWRDLLAPDPSLRSG